MVQFHICFHPSPIMKKYVTILISIAIFFLFIPQVFSGEDPLTRNEQIQREKYQFSTDLIKALRYCIQGEKIVRTRSPSNEQLEISNRKLSERSEKLKEMEEKIEIAQKKLSSNEFKDLVANLNRELDAIAKDESADIDYFQQVPKTTYLYREKLIQAKTVMENWEDSRDETIRKVAQSFLEGLDDLFFSTEQILKLLNKKVLIDQSHKDLLSRVTRSGQDKILWSSSDLLYVIYSKKTKTKPLQFYLTETQLLSIVQNIDDIFREEFDEKQEPVPVCTITIPLFAIKQFILEKIEETKGRPD